MALSFMEGYPEVPHFPKSQSNLVSHLHCNFAWAFAPRVTRSVLFVLIRGYLIIVIFAVSDW